jgi:hypothetical protein
MNFTLSSIVGAGGTAPLEECVAHVTDSQGFRIAPVLAKLLNFLATGSHPESAGRLTAYQIALAVFDQPTDFDPQTNSLVRVNMSRLRQLLAEYYAHAGAEDSWRLFLPRGSYTLRLVEHQRENSGVSQRLPSLSVLHLANLKNNPKQDHFSDLITLELVHLLTQNPALRVVVPHTGFPLPKRMGKPVKVVTDYELACGASVRDTGKQPPYKYEFLFTATLEDVAGKRILWKWESDKLMSVNSLRSVLETITTEAWQFVVAPHAPVEPLPKGKLRWKFPE